MGGGGEKTKKMIFNPQFQNQENRLKINFREF
jgi:hypothetical protein